MSVAIDLIERGLVPAWLTRLGIRHLNRQRLREQRGLHGPDPAAALERFVDTLGAAPVALHTHAANEQHYEVPARFFELVLGPLLKYSSCYWPADETTLAAAEETMLELTETRAEIRDGMDILELGCGWGSMTLWMAERHPGARIVAVSNSSLQRQFILERCSRRGLENVEVLTCDVNTLRPAGAFDRVVSVEMLEHMRNLPELLRRVASWLRPEGKLFAHIFCHRRYAYLFQTEGDDNWMGRHFFTGGMMPSADLLERVGGELRVQRSWCVDGRHYQRTADAWLTRLEGHREEVLELFRGHYGVRDCRRWYERWRVFFMACSELFGCRCGSEWFVLHALLGRDATP